MINAFRWAQEEERGTQIRKNFLMRPDLHWGFRVGAGYERDCSYGQVSYLWYESYDVAALTRSEFVLPLVLIGVGTQADDFQKVENRLTLRYQNVDLRWGQRVLHGCDRSFDLFGNVRWVDLQRKMRSRGLNEQGVSGIWTQHSRFNGAALGVGASAQFGIWECFSFVGQINSMAVIGEREVPTNKRNDRGTITNESYPGDTAVIPALDLRFGINLAHEVCCNGFFFLEIGYELHHYWHALNYTQDGSTNIAIISCQDIGFAGPYLMLKGSY
jgi:Legionella pneumophila major outer membrane protein precursor